MKNYSKCGPVVRPEVEDEKSLDKLFKEYATSRAYNRQMKTAKLLRRLKVYIRSDETKTELFFDSLRNKLTHVPIEYQEREALIQDGLNGKGYTSLRTTSCPCNCDMCTYKKYKRTLKQNRIE